MTRFPTLLEACSFYMEKNEILDGWGYRQMTFETKEDARGAYDSMVEEAMRFFRNGKHLPLEGGALAEEFYDATKLSADGQPRPALRIGVSGTLVQLYVAAPPMNDYWSLSDGGPEDEDWYRLRSLGEEKREE